MGDKWIGKYTEASRNLATFGKLSCHVHIASVAAKSKQTDLIKKHYCLNCCVHLLERFHLLMVLTMTPSNSTLFIAVSRGYFIPWQFPKKSSVSTLQIMIPPSPFCTAYSVWNETHKSWGICEKKQWIFRCFFMQCALSSRTGERGHSYQYLHYLVLRHM